MTDTEIFLTERLVRLYVAVAVSKGRVTPRHYIPSPPPGGQIGGGALRAKSSRIWEEKSTRHERLNFSAHDPRGEPMPWDVRIADPPRYPPCTSASRARRCNFISEHMLFQLESAAAMQHGRLPLFLGTKFHPSMVCTLIRRTKTLP